MGISSIGPSAALFVKRLEAREANMQTNEDAHRHRLTVRPLIFKETTLIAALLAVFVFLHVLAGSVLQRTEKGVAASELDLKLQLYD
jgi:hypothetical protein